VAPDGYERSWNIIKEASKAPDVEFLLDLMMKVGETFPEADMGDVTIVGTSNGAGMIHRLLIETPSPLPFQRVIPMVSSLISDQYHDGSFWKRSDPSSENYDSGVSPANPGPNFLYFHGTSDGAVPYDGGRGILGLQFVGAQAAAYAWASYWGETSPQLGDGDGTVLGDDLVSYTYLGGKVVHYKVIGGEHSIPIQGQIKDIITEAILGN